MRWSLLLGLCIVGLIIYLIHTEILEDYSQNEPKLNELVKIIEPMFKRDDYYTGVLESLNNRDIIEEVKFYEGNRSYTINKQKVYMCLKDEKSDYYNNNFLIFVLLHEIAHVICDEVGHTEKFHEIFEELIDRATKMNIYNPKIPAIQNYCEY